MFSNYNISSGFNNVCAKFNLQMLILLVLCGILITCFVNIYHPLKTFPLPKTKLDVQQGNITEQFQTENELTIAKSAKYNKQLRAMFAVNIITQASSGSSRTNNQDAYLNLLALQTLPKTNPDDIIVTNFYLKNKDISHTSPALDQLVAFVLSLKEDRVSDFFLKADNGVDVNILFKYNYKSDFNDTVDVEAIVTEKLPENRSSGALPDSEKASYKSITFDTCTIEYNIKDIIKLTLKKSVILPENAFILPQGVTDPNTIAGQKEILQEFVIYIQTDGLLTTLDGNKPLALELVIANFIPYNSIMEYKVSMRIGNATTYTNYLTWQMYLKNASTDKVNANTFLSEKLALKQKELLHDKYNNIITPMFMVDNKINNLEKSIQNIQSTYNFNKLNNMASNTRFYPVTQ